MRWRRYVLLTAKVFIFAFSTIAEGLFPTASDMKSGRSPQNVIKAVVVRSLQ